MSRSITDPIEEEPEEQKPTEQQPEMEEAMTKLILGYNKLYDRVINLERRLDEIAGPDYVKVPKLKKFLNG